MFGGAIKGLPCTMTKVKVRHGETLEQALRRFNRAVLKAGILRELRDRERYSKPSEVLTKRKKKKRAKFILKIRGIDSVS